MSLSDVSNATALMLAQSITLEQWKWGDVTVQKHFNTDGPSVRPRDHLTIKHTQTSCSSPISECDKL